jgi:hypothetical protein
MATAMHILAASFVIRIRALLIAVTRTHDLLPGQNFSILNPFPAFLQAVHAYS